MSAPDDLAAAIRAWLDAPINDHGTPYVGHPEDFTPEEQREFVRLVREDRYVSREEQLALLRAIVARRNQPGE